jgi:serine/threonine protein kinase
VLRQRYRLLQQIGSGGFGAVYKAEDQQLGNRVVAVKEMSARGLTPEETQEATEGFRREALLLARLSHPNLPRIHEQFEEDGRWYLVMDFIEGETLEDYLEDRGGSLPVKEALQLGLQLSGVLGYLHTRQPPIIFRDLKPGNVMITPDDNIYLIDFGIARLFKPGQTKDTMAFGSPGYAAPEQYGKAQTTPRSDVFSLGALLHHMLTGTDPSDTPFRFKPLTMPRPSGLSTLIERMVDIDAQKRPATMDDIHRDLERMLYDTAPWHADERTMALPGAVGHPSVAPVSASAYQPPPTTAWANQAGPVTQFPPAQKKKKGNVGWIVGIVLVGWAVFSSLLGHSTSSTSNSYNDGSSNYPGSSNPSGNSIIAVNTVAWSPDGSEIASGGGDALLQIWNAHTAKQVTTVRTDFDSITAAAWSPNGKYIAAVGDKPELQVWYAGGGPFVSVQVSTADRINALAWSPDNTTLALACNDGSLWVVHIGVQTSSKPLYQASSVLTTVAWSPNGKYIAVGGDEGTVGVWDAAADKLDYTYKDGNVIEAVAWSPDSQRLASADFVGRVVAWDALTGKNPFAYSYPYAANAIAWSPDGKYIAAGSDNSSVQVWGVGDPTPLYIFVQQIEYLAALAWSPDSSRIASASDNGNVQVWDALTGDNIITYVQPK